MCRPVRSLILIPVLTEAICQAFGSSQAGKSLTPSSSLRRTRESILTSYCDPRHVLCSHVALRARKSLAMQCTTFAGSGVEALDPILEPEQAKREMVMMPAGGEQPLR
ncbi:hypothetical protein EDB86DRAFT_2826308 [Lactarius hatsudake]|nr:hypothetical protein EDB86DRAFT_2826308 [Lactarius hatsudake]